MRAAQHEDHLGVLELLVPGVLEQRKHGRVRFDGIRKFVEDEDVAAISQKGSDCLPAVGPRVERGCPGRLDPQEAGEEFAALQGSRLLLSSPVGVGHVHLLGPMAQQDRLAHAAAAIEQDELGGGRSLSVED
jgi:hypothetical protein